MTRRDFLVFFLMGGFFSLINKKMSGQKLNIEKSLDAKKAMFWRKKDEA